MTLSTAGILGPILGPISARGVGGAGGVGFVVTNFPYNFAIGGLPFLLATNPQEPYQRATATFRKDQFDSASNVGDQSLTGWWTRGQFSFHQGAGIRYNDAFSDADTGTRYFEGIGVNPWTPGQLTLSGSWVDRTVVRHGTSGYMLGGYNGFAPTVYYVSGTDSKLYSIASMTPISAASCGGFAVDPNPGGTVYYLAGTHIKNRAGTWDSVQGDALLFEGLWWAHGRLVAVDSNGAWYTFGVLGAGTTVHSADAFWPGDGFSGGWVVSDSPGAIFMARGRSVYKLTLNSDGTVPTLAAPTVAAEVPDDEAITAMSYYLGFLVIVTNRGVRIGLTDSTGNVQYGPAVVEFQSSTCRSVAAVGSKVYCTGTRAGDTTEQVFVIDLAQPTTPGVFAYSLETPPNFGTDPNTGVTYSNNLIYSYSDNSFQQISGREPQSVPFLTAGANGYVETGFIRLGTMEPKAFHSVKVKLQGSEGSVDISVVRRGGSATLLTNLPASNQADYDVALDMAAPEEYIALRFTLIAGPGGLSPTLLGYQVRALPAPSTRTRIIQAPLQCFDYETAPNGGVQGADGWAVARLLALEELESSAGLVLFQDFRTGEQAQVFIEQTAFTDIGPEERAPGFGGTITATLRKVT